MIVYSPSFTKGVGQLLKLVELDLFSLTPPPSYSKALHSPLKARLKMRSLFVVLLTFAVVKLASALSERELHDDHRVKRHDKHRDRPRHDDYPPQDLAKFR
jgi:hypothetical protein